jgi:Rhodanese-like domain
MYIMKKKTLVLAIAIACLCSTVLLANTFLFRKANVDFEGYEKILEVVKEHRKDRLIDLEKFKAMSKKKNVVLLDARSANMYNSKHIKGAVNLNFSDFTRNSLAAVIPDLETTVLIYCNNNFEGDEVNFASKVARPIPAINSKQDLSLALNIPTYINLYGYGYRNVYELSEMVNVFDGRVAYEGTSVAKNKVKK